MENKKILFICTGNSCRSQMAEGFARHLGWTAYSAGVSPSPVNPNAVQVMREAGIDISHQLSNHVDEFLNTDFDYIVTLCDHARQTCPVFRGRTRKRIHQPFPDPIDATGTDDDILKTYRRVRDMIHEWLKAFTLETSTSV